MGFLKKVKNINQKGIGQAMLDATMSAVDKAKSGEDGPAPILRYARENGYSGSPIAGAFKTALPTIGSGEVQLAWTAWALNHGASSGWHPQRHVQGGAAALVHCVRTEGRVVIISPEGEVILEHELQAGERPEVALANEVTFGIVKKDELDMSNPGVRASEKLQQKMGLKDRSPARVYRDVIRVRMQTDPNLAPKAYDEYPGTVVTIPASSDRGPFQMVVLSIALEDIVAALTG